MRVHLNHHSLFLPIACHAVNLVTADLNDESVYRDLSLPIGALTKERLKMFQDRSVQQFLGLGLNTTLNMICSFLFFSYDSLDDASMGISVPPFHYGTHYSTAGSVLFYLIRQEPYCTLSILQQDGKFDYPVGKSFFLFSHFFSCLQSKVTPS